MILETVGSIIGSLVAAWIVFSLFSFFLATITRYRWSINKNLNFSLGLSIIFALFWGDFWGLTPDQSILLYVPAIIVIYFIDRRLKLSKKCPNCKERIKVDAEKCKHCHTENLNRNVAIEG